MNWRFTADETAHGLNLTGPSLTIASADYEPVLTSAGFPADLILGEDLEAAMEGAPDTDPGCPVEPEDGMVIIFTSGTTGHPKGALISHRAMIARALIYGAELAVPADDTFVAWTPLFHMGANDFALATLLRGGRVVVMDGYRPKELIRAIETWPVHYLTAVPGMVEDFVTRLKASSRDFKPIGMVGAMADLVPRQQLKEITGLLNAPWLNTFGSTETGIPPATANFVPVGAAPETLSKAQNAFLRDPPRRRARQRRGVRRARRARDPRPEPVLRLLGQRRGQPRSLPPRVVPHGRRVPPQPRRHARFRRPGEIHDQVGRREHLPRRDRTAHPGGCANLRRRRGAQARRPLGRGAGGVRREEPTKR